MGGASSSAPSSSSVPALPSSKPPPWEKFDESRCAFDLAPLGSTNALFAASRQLRDRADLDALVAKGIAGTPERLGLRVEGTFGASCECEPFHAWFSASDKSFTPIIDIEKQGVPQVGFGTTLTFILIGYFSGAYINIYEQRRVQGVKPRKPDEEERPVWPRREPEFCVEALCYRAPEPEHGFEARENDSRARFLRKVAPKHAKHMAKLGVPRCKSQWTSLSPRQP